MAYSVQKSRLAKVAGVSLVLLLAACSSDSRYKRQVSGDEAYLEAAPLAELHGPGWNDLAGDLRRLCNPGDQR
ncbi:lipoprotein [Escherichia coli]|uniref:Lipoprotein n=1 Tax=Escherichia coli TaxID=562 RepID=A0A484WZX0_ECOLX|nr:lipoprotein [Escherichia coli]